MSELRRQVATSLVNQRKFRNGSSNSRSGSRTGSSSAAEDDASEYYSDLFSEDDDDAWSIASNDTVGSDTSVASTGSRSSTSAAAAAAARKKDKDTAENYAQKLNEYVDIVAITTGGRKSSNLQSRIDAWSRIGKILALKYAWRTVEQRRHDLHDAVARAIRHGRSGSNTEVVLSCRVLSLLAATDPDHAGWLELALWLLRAVVISGSNMSVNDDDDDDSGGDDAATEGAEQVKIAAVNTVTAVLLLSHAASQHDVTASLQSFLDLIQDACSSASASSSSPAVLAHVLAAVGVLVTVLDDALEFSQDAVLPIVDLLDSPDLKVRLAAGQDIALFYERHAEDMTYYGRYDEDDDDNDDDEDDDKAEVPELYYDNDELIYKLTQLATVSSKRIAKSSRKEQHSVFRDVLDTVKTAVAAQEALITGIDEPAYSDAGTIDSSTAGSGSGGGGGGGRVNFKLKFEQGLTLIVDSWASYLRLVQLRKVFSHGLAVHYTKNRDVRIALDPYHRWSSSKYERASASHTPPVQHDDDYGGDDYADDDNNDDDVDLRAKEIARSINRESRRLRQADIQKARNTSRRELFNRQLHDHNDEEENV
ncbi:interferon-related developmental regulator-domain-containing protein [Lipomyces japonicus]|uniref:interferon-related developmental regulator-domain-containing protein n=1 Tax=Lipomyces japonicus TaxID=56871 RepID=UPI0034CF6304